MDVILQDALYGGLPPVDNGIWGQAPGNPNGAAYCWLGGAAYCWLEIGVNPQELPTAGWGEAPG